MKTWEMIKELTENPKKQFSLIESKANMVAFDKETRQLVWEQGSKFEIFNSTLKQEWEEVRKPLTFVEVLERVRENDLMIEIDGKRASGVEYQGKDYLDDLLMLMGDTLFSSEIAKILLEGKFYIEED